MKFAVNYSPGLAGLVRAGQITIDRYKCPAWPDLVDEASRSLPVNIHFPISIGAGTGAAIHDEKHEPVDLDWLAGLVEQTGTPYINTHLITPADCYPGMDLTSHSHADARRVLDGARRDLDGLLKRFGPEKILVENVINEFGWLDLCALPETLARLLDETGCGFLFDLSHARLASANFGIDPRVYANEMPLDRLREMHITGLKLLEGELLELVRSSGDPYGLAKSMAGRKIDHLPMEEEDWQEFAWALDQIKAQAWNEPWVVSFEYGGVGPFWEQITRTEVYLDQLPKMGAMIRLAGMPGVDDRSRK